MRKYQKLEPKIKKVLSKLLLFTKKSQGSVSVFLVDNATMKKINQQSRSKNQVTNVLAFPRPKSLILPPDSKKYLGDIYLAPDYIKKHNEDIVYVLIHGFLHLLGFDHRKKDDNIKMSRKEQHLLKRLSI